MKEAMCLRSCPTGHGIHMQFPLAVYLKLFTIIESLSFFFFFNNLGSKLLGWADASGIPVQAYGKYDPAW